MSAAAPYVGVIGASEATPAERECARMVGIGLAKMGAIVICGGRGGVMEAVCEGAKEGNGLTVGVLPGADRADANPYVDVALTTDLGELRNGLVVRFSDALIAIGGSWGTLSEIAFAIRTGHPVVAIGSWEAVAAQAEAETPSAAPGAAPFEGETKVVQVQEPGEAVYCALQLARRAVPEGR